MKFVSQFATCISLLATLMAVFHIKETHSELRQTYANSVEAASARYAFASSNELLRAVRASLEEHEQQRLRNKHPRSKRATKRVCYGELGCFEDSGPFAYLEMLPSTPEEINTRFYFYSTRNRSDRPLMELPFANMTAAFEKYASNAKSSKRSVPDAKIETNEQSLASANLTTTTTTTTTSTPTTKKSLTAKRQSSSLKHPVLTLDDLDGFDELSVRVIVHGFGSACPHVWIYEMKTALMAVEDCIVICVDWENGATFPNYVRAAANTRLVGKQLAMLLNNLREHKNLNLTRTHLIGFSLGAHASGFAGAELPGLARITGLDPAGPLFESQHPKVRLDSSDAVFVDVIHSNGENLILGGLGSWQPMGDVDYYPNGGRVQTGCSNLFVGAVTDFIWSAQTADEEEGRSLCNHRRAYKFFIDSVAPRCLFPAFPCDNYDDFLKGKCFPCAQSDQDVANGLPRCGNMGYYADRSTGRGQLYLLTREEEPFCAHQFLLQIFNSFNDLPLRTIGRLEATLEGESGLNETFQISEKDDSEFFAGDIVSKIIVPHPALGFPTTLSLNYKSYSGWLSKGLPHWDIDKVVLTDSFGRSHSLCKPSTKLSSGNPVRIKLLHGDCELENQDEYGILTTPSSVDVPDSNVQESVLIANANIGFVVDAAENANAKQFKNSFSLSAGEKSDRNVIFSDKHIDGQVSWQPIIEGNSLDKDISGSEMSRSLSSKPTEIFEPVLSERSRIIAGLEPVSEIVEPVLKATTPRQRKKAKGMLFREGLTGATTSAPSHKLPAILRFSNTSIAASDKSTVAVTAAPNDPLVTVQLFPFRLGELLQRAERYARETLLPLISIQAPKFFGFAPPDANREDARKPRYIPRYELDAIGTNSSRSPNTKVKRTAKRRSKTGEIDGDLVAEESQDPRNIFELLRDEFLPNKVTRRGYRSRANVSYYTNTMLSRSRTLEPEDANYQPIFIDLPTYRPNKRETPKQLRTATPNV